jgi:hypothetical protein
MELRYIFVAIIVAISVGAVAWEYRQSNSALRHYWKRNCMGRAWRRTFPSASKSDIRELLGLLARTFAFSSSRMLQFAPTDSLLSIYRAKYPVEGWPDALELETFERDLKRSYGLELRDFWRDNLTLGEIFDRCRARVT